MLVLNKSLKNNLDFKKIVYFVNIFTVLIQFISSSFCSVKYPRELGLAAIFISFFGILYQAAQFEGSFLYLSKKLNYSNLLKKSISTCLIIFVIQLLISLYFLISKNFVSLAFFNQFAILCLGYWMVDLVSGKDRILDDKKSEFKYQKHLIFNLITFGIVPNIITFLILLLSPSSSFLWIIFSLTLFATSIFSIFYLFILYKKQKFNSCYKFTLPKLTFLLAPTIKRAESSSFLIIIGILLGPTIFGNLQPIIKIGKSTNILTPIIMKLNFLEIDRKIKNKWLNPLFSLNYLSTILLAIFVYLLLPNYLTENSSLILTILIFINFASTNHKTFIWTLNYKIGNSDFILKSKSLLLISKIFLFLLFYYLGNLFQINLNFIIFALVIFEIIWILYINIIIKNIKS